MAAEGVIGLPSRAQLGASNKIIVKVMHVFKPFIVPTVLILARYTRSWMVKTPTCPRNGAQGLELR
jgi:hypothetical protein